jgi:hypothetical protein
MGWLFVKKHPAIVEAGKKLSFEDLADDSTVMFQKKLGNYREEHTSVKFYSKIVGD